MTKATLPRLPITDPELNTRKFPRTLGEAFKDAHYACAVEKPTPRYPRALWWVMALGFFVAIWTVRTS